MLISHNFKTINIKTTQVLGSSAPCWRSAVVAGTEMLLADPLSAVGWVIDESGMFVQYISWMLDRIRIWEVQRPDQQLFAC